MRQPWPWFSETRSGGGWFVKLGGDQHFLGKHPIGAASPDKKKGKWNPRPRFWRNSINSWLCGTQPRSPTTPSRRFCALYVEELSESDDELAKRYDQILGYFCDHEYKGRQIGKLLVNAELEGQHLKSWVQQYPSEQTQRTLHQLHQGCLKLGRLQEANQRHQEPGRRCQGTENSEPCGRHHQG